MATLMVQIVFVDCPALDIDGSVEALERAGYRVHRMPDKYGGTLGDPLDDFLEAVTEGRDDERVIRAMRDEVQAIVWPRGGDVVEWGPVGSDYRPFAAWERYTIFPPG